MWQFWIDRGGTFTDIVAVSPDGTLSQHKLLSENPTHYVDAALAGIRQVLVLLPYAPLTDGVIGSVKMGTTVGTNALLTHTGARTVLITTAGFADVLEIGEQSRADIFALNIQKSTPLYAAVIEAQERMNVHGEIQKPLDRNQLREQLRQKRSEGFSACAIAFLHSWKNPQNEQAAADIALDEGFTQITLSHQASPLIKYVPRAETAVLDAALSPPVRHYVQQVTQALPPDVALSFMQSNGGLSDAAHFQGKDSVLSGPAGGLIGRAKVGQAAGFNQLIGFDMGGTSTDVSLFNGEFEHTLDTRIAGYRLRVPMLDVHTVAAGGGSLLKFDGGRLLVGPESAGSLPGPTCYRHGGPLSVTDANLLLGRIQPDFFPALFGPEGNATLDQASVTSAFARFAAQLTTQLSSQLSSQLSCELSCELSYKYSPEHLAQGFIDIAVEHMADAIRHMTLARGVNPADYTLVSFGGAGGQHACAVAARLGMHRILISPFASVLSAYGIGLAEQRIFNLVAIEQPLTDNLVFADCPENVDGVTVQQRVRLRYDGSDTVLAIPIGSIQTMAAGFHAEHHARFGFADPGRPLICVALETETITGGGHPAPLPNIPLKAASAIGVRRIYLGHQWVDTPLYHALELCAGQTVAGPAMLIEPGSTLIVEPGWQAERTARGDLVLSSGDLHGKRPDPAMADPTWITLFNRRFMRVAEEMGRVLQSTARSVNIRERLDFSCALFDAKGNLIANAPHIPVHLGSMGDSVRAIQAKFSQSLQPGDAYLINCPYAGGTHLPDITVVMPVFDETPVLNETTQTLRYFTAARAHHADIGGMSPGSMPADSTHIDQEGCRSDGLLVVRHERFLEAEVHAWLNSNIHHPARNPGQNIADLQAQIAACTNGARQLAQLESETSPAAVMAYMEFVQDNAEQAVKRLLQQLPNGHFTLPLDGGAQISVNITVEAGQATIDFTGTSPQQPGNLNAPASIAHSAVLYVFRTLLDEALPLNAGVMRPLKVVLPAGSLLNPVYPAAVVAGNVETSQNIVDALYGALGVLAASQGSMNNFTFGNATHQYYETVCGGAGAGAGFDGASGVHTHMTNSRLTDPEVMELNFPVHVERFSLRLGSGGAGKWHGGHGVIRRLRFLAPMHANLLALRRHTGSFGLQGGAPGQLGRQWVERCEGQVELLPGVGQFKVYPGDVFVLETPGGGGFGDRSGNSVPVNPRPENDAPCD